MRSLKLVCCLSFLAGALVVAATVGHAQASNPSAAFQLTSDHCGPLTGGDGSGYCGLNDHSQSVFGTILVTDLGGGTLEFAISLLHGNQFVNTGFPLTLGFNLAGNPLITYSNLTSGFGIPSENALHQQNAGSYHQDGTGNFEYGVLWGPQGGGHGTSDSLTFDINATGLTLASLEQNAPGFNQFFAVDILSGTTGATGNVDAGSVCTTCFVVPEPDSLALIGVGLFALYGFGRRRRSRASLN